MNEWLRDILSLLRLILVGVVVLVLALAKFWFKVAVEETADAYEWTKRWPFLIAGSVVVLTLAWWLLRKRPAQSTYSSLRSSHLAAGDLDDASPPPSAR